MKSIVIGSITISLIAYLGFGFFLYVFQRSFLYHPSPEVGSDQYGQYESIWMNDLKVWLINPGKSKALVYFGGNSEGVEHNIDEYIEFFPDHTIYLPNYRGFGGSPGKPSEQGLYEDALAIYDQLTEYESIDILGRSLGSGVATYLAAQRKVNKLVLITPYDSITKVAQRIYPMYPADVILRDKYESIKRAHQIDAQVLIVIAALDTLIPPSHSYELADQFPAATLQTLLVEDAAHGDIHSNKTYQKHLEAFINN